MHTAFGGGNTVGEGVDALVVTGVPLEGHFDLLGLFGLFDVPDLLKERLFRRVQVADVVHDSTVVLEGLLLFATLALVGEADFKTLVQKGHDLETLGHRLGAEVNLFKDRGVWIEGDRRTGATARSRAGDLELALGLTAVEELQDVVVTVAVYFDLQRGG